MPASYTSARLNSGVVPPSISKASLRHWVATSSCSARSPALAGSCGRQAHARVQPLLQQALSKLPLTHILQRLQVRHDREGQLIARHSQYRVQWERPIGQLVRQRGHHHANAGCCSSTRSTQHRRGLGLRCPIVHRIARELPCTHS